MHESEPRLILESPTTPDKIQFIFELFFIWNLICGFSGNSKGGVGLGKFFMSIGVEIMPKYGLEVDLSSFGGAKTLFAYN